MANTLHSPVQNQEPQDQGPQNQGLQNQRPQKHQENIAESLVHRTEVANIHQDLQLLQLLQKEQEQLEAFEAQAPQRLNLWQWLASMMAKRTQVSVEEIQGPSGKAWRAYNPRTGQSRYAETLAEITAWLEAQHLNR
jgi:hypothetical protein